mgnify:FL=1
MLARSTFGHAHRPPGHTPPPCLVLCGQKIDALLPHRHIKTKHVPSFVDPWTQNNLMYKEEIALFLLVGSQCFKQLVAPDVASLLFHVESRLLLSVRVVHFWINCSHCKTHATNLCPNACISNLDNGCLVLLRLRLYMKYIYLGNDPHAKF